MHPRLQALIAQQQAAGFPGLAGSEVHATIKLSTPLLNEAIAGLIASVTSPIRELTVEPHSGNRIDVRVDPAKAFIPTVNLTLVVDRQPQLPADPTLILRVTSGAAMLRFAAPVVSGLGALPAGIRLDGERILVDVRALLQAQGQARLLDLAREIEVVTMDGAVVVFVHAMVGSRS
jgi:hypothetical protein